MRPEVEAALARMEARRVAPQAEPIQWRWWYSSKKGCCGECGAKLGLMVYEVRPQRREALKRPDGTVFRNAERFSWLGRRCLDRAVCVARAKKKREARTRRTGSLEWRCSRHQRSGKGICAWCGKPIVLVDPKRDYRRLTRSLHYDDEYEVGGSEKLGRLSECQRAYYGSRTTDARYLIQARGDPCCVDCGDTGPEWEADHDLALEDGGAHCPTNIVRRCVPCHKAKTKRENAARREARRVDKAQAAA